MMILLALAATVAQPSAEAEKLGRQLADHGTLAAMLPLLEVKETEELVAEAKGLSSAEVARLRATADKSFAIGRERLLAASGHAYAQRLTVTDLRALVAFHESDAAKHADAAMPEVIAATMQSVGAMDFKGDVRKAFCAETGKLCPPK